MKVTLLASTAALPVAYQTLNYDYGFDGVIPPKSADVVAEFAGRACYQSFNKPNPATAKNADYLGNVISQAHYSVLEHNSFTFYIEGVSRALTHELIRHRHLSYSQLSQRFVNESDRAAPISPPAFRQSESAGRLQALLAYVDHITHEAYKEAAHILEKGDGLTRKQAREAARCFLPNMTETKIVVTGNLRAWREFVAKRNNEHADAEIQELAELIQYHLDHLAPNSMQEVQDR